MASHRRTAAAAVAAVLASISLYPVFTGMLWFFVGCGSVIVVALAGTATRLRRLPVLVTLALGGLALLLYLNLVFSNARSFYHLLPTPNSVAALWDLTGQGFAEASRYAPPVPELRGMVLLCAAGIGITALLTDLIAVRLGSAALAGLPLLLLFIEPFTLTVSHSFPGTAIAFCAAVIGYLTMLSSEGRDQIRAWEQRPSDSWRDEPDTRPLAAAGRRVAFASVVLALCLPLFIPGLHVTRLFRGHPGIGGSGGTVGFPNPNAQLSQELHESSPSNVLLYTTTDSEPGYLQIYALDKLTDNGWTMFAAPESLAPVNPRMPAPPGLTSDASAAKESSTISLANNLGQDELDALPAPYPATSVQAPGSLHADRSTLMLFDNGVKFGGLQYKVTSLDQSPTPQQLNSAPAPPATIKSRYLSVPSSYLPLRKLALSFMRVAGAKTPFEKAVALQNWLAGGTFHYTLKAPTVHDAASLTRFLESTKRGYCLQFSFAMAVLARLLGIPSRVAYGFTSGTSVSSNTWLVTTHDAHAWPELYFQGYGWLRFEPTPSGATGQGTAYAPSYTLAPLNPLSPGKARSTPGTTPGQTASGAPSIPANVRNPFAEHGGGTAAAVAAGGGGLNPWEIFGLVLAGLIAAAAAAPWTARRVIRQRRWRRARVRGGAHVPDAPRIADGTDGGHSADAARAHAAWRELRDDLNDFGTPLLPSESPRAVAARAGRDLGLTGAALAALDRIVLAEERARYAPRPVDGAGLHGDSATVRQAIAARVPRGTRWRARLLPASVLRPALGAVASASDLYRGSRSTDAGPRLRFRWRRARRHPVDGVGDAARPEDVTPARAGTGGS